MPLKKSLLPVQAISFNDDEPKSIVIYLVGGPASTAIRSDGESLEFLRTVFPNGLVIVPAYAGTIDRVPFVVSRTIPLARREIAALVRQAGEAFPGTDIFLIGESFGSYLTSDIGSNVAGLLYLSAPSGSVSETLERMWAAAGPTREQVDRTNVTLINDENAVVGGGMVRRSDLVKTILQHPSADDFRLSKMLSAHNCAVAVLGDRDHLMRPQDAVFSPHLRNQVVVIKGMGHKRPEASDVPDARIATGVKRYFHANCR